VIKANGVSRINLAANFSKVSGALFRFAIFAFGWAMMVRNTLVLDLYPERRHGFVAAAFIGLSATTGCGRCR
jgi:hypothetical protein